MEEQKKNPEGPTLLGATTRQEQWKEECETNNASRKQDKFNTQHHMCRVTAELLEEQLWK